MLCEQESQIMADGRTAAQCAELVMSAIYSGSSMEGQDEVAQS